ncbi:MAG: hypothetical protein V1645_01000 [archaeon]
METVVAWVLLLGFSITLGVFVFMWATKSTTDFTESTVGFVEGGMQCEQVQIYAVFSEDPNDPTNKCYLNITNNGYFTIDEIIIRGTAGTTSIPKQEIKTPPFVPLKPKERIDGNILGLPKTGLTLDIIPAVKDKNKIIACPEKMITVQC